MGWEFINEKKKVRKQEDKHLSKKTRSRPRKTFFFFFYKFSALYTSCWIEKASWNSVPYFGRYWGFFEGRVHCCTRLNSQLLNQLNIVEFFIFFSDAFIHFYFPKSKVLLIHREIQALRASDDGTGRICEGRRGKRSVIEVLPHL